MSEGVTVQVLGTARGEATVYDGQYVARWSPHTEYGACALETTPDRAQARVFASMSEALEEYRTISNVEPTRPDGRPNRPLTGLSIEIERVP